MNSRMPSILGAAVAAFVVAWVGVTYWFGPAMAADAPADPILPGWVSLGIVSIVSALFLDWINQSVGQPMKSAMVIAISQILLVDVYYVLNGTRGIRPALASVVILLAMWGVAGTAYGKLAGGASTD